VKPEGLQVLVVGTGRCGTGFLAHSLEQSGFTCGHEAIFNHWDEEKVRQRYLASSLTAEASWAAAPFLGADWLDPAVKVIHLTRNPMEVIKSFHDINFFSTQRVQKPLNQLVYRNASIKAETQDRLQSAVTHYYEWNALIRDALRSSGRPAITLRLEDAVSDAGAAQRVSEFLGVAFTPVASVVNPKTGEKAAHEDVPFDRAAALALMQVASAKHGDFGYPSSRED
jgi:hypothetical protein